MLLRLRIHALQALLSRIGHYLNDFQSRITSVLQRPSLALFYAQMLPGQAAKLMTVQRDAGLACQHDPMPGVLRLHGQL